MPSAENDAARFREYRNSRLYRSLGRILKAYNRVLIVRLRAAGFTDFAPAFPALLSNLDMNGTRIGVLAKRAGVTRQAAGQLLREIERCGYVERRESVVDARATVVQFTAKGRRMHATVARLVEEVEDDLAAMLTPGDFDTVRAGLRVIADHIDPTGGLGTGDEPSLDSERSEPPRKRNARTQRSEARRTS